MFKNPIEFPAQEDMQMLSEGIAGIHSDIAPTSRAFGLLSDVSNLERYGVTGAKTRRGRVPVGGSFGSSTILGLSSFYKSSGEDYLIANVGSTWHAYDGSSWSSVETGIDSSARVEAATFGDLHIMTNGVDPVKKFDGTSVSDLGGDPPESKYITVAYNRVFLVDSPHLLRSSEVMMPEEWLTGDSAAIPINDKDGDEIMWVQLYRTNVIIWKRHSIHELHGPEMGEISANWRALAAGNFGTVNGRTIKEVKGTLFWLSDSPNNKGVVAWSGGNPEVVSEAVESIIDRINWNHIDKACAGTDGDGAYLLSVPLDASTSPNAILVFNTNDGSWWVWEDWSVTKFNNFRIEGRDERLVMGDTDSTVYSIGGEDDDGDLIPYRAVFGPTTLGSSFDRKRVRRAVIVASVEDDGSLSAKVSNNKSGSYGLELELVSGYKDASRIRRGVPLNTAEPSSGFIYRLMLHGEGNVIIHDVGLEVSRSEGE